MAKREKMSMREIRKSALELATREYTRVNTKLWTTSSRSFSINHVRQLIDFCLRKEYRAGEHQGALNPYC